MSAPAIPCPAPDLAPERAPADAGPDRGQILLRLLMLAALLSVPFIVSLRAEIDPDVWWHMRVGEWVLGHGDVPQNDPFSAYGQERPWVAYSWLFEVLVYTLYSWLGLWGMLAYQGGMSLLVTLALYRLVSRRQPHFVLAVALTGVATLALAMMFKQRPWMFTLLFGLWTLEAVLVFREGRRSRLVWALPVAYALWANIHIQLVYGLMLLALGVAAPVLDRWLGRDGASPLKAFSPRWWQLTALAGLCFLATFVNPYHVRIYQVVLEYASQPAPYRLVNELRALEFRDVCDWVMLGLAAAALFALGRRAVLSSFDVLLLLAAGFFAFRARRDLWLLTIVSTWILACSWRRPATAADRLAMTPLRWSFVGALVLAAALTTVRARELGQDALERAVHGQYPAEAARVVRERGYPGPLYNDFSWGGYLIWALPDHPVALDGRTNLHGDERLIRSYNVWLGLPEWQDDPELGRAGVVIADVSSPLTSLLRRDDRFMPVHEDDRAVVFLARRAAGDGRSAAISNQ